MEWIKVDSETPKNTTVLTCTKNGGIITAYLTDKGNWWVETFGQWNMEVPDEVTHWMPLPAKPEN